MWLFLHNDDKQGQTKTIGRHFKVPVFFPVAAYVDKMETSKTPHSLVSIGYVTKKESRLGQADVDTVSCLELC